MKRTEFWCQNSEKFSTELNQNRVPQPQCNRTGKFSTELYLSLHRKFRGVNAHRKRDLLTQLRGYTRGERARKGFEGRTSR